MFGTPVQRATDGTVIQRAWWNPFDWAKDAAGWLGEQFMHGLEWMGEKAAQVFVQVFAAAAKPYGAVGIQILTAIKNIGAPLKAILANPGLFASNLVNGVKQGFTNFVAHAPEHLSKVLGSFLTGKGLTDGSALRLTLPERLEPMPILMALLSTFNLGWQGIRDRIAARLGPKGQQAITRAEGSVPLIKTLSKGLHNTDEFTKKVLPELKTQAVDGIKTAAQEGLIRVGINLLLKLIPGAGTISAIFDTVRVLIDRARDLSSLATNVIGAFGAMAGGNLAVAARAVEGSLVTGIRVTLDFVSKLAKLDSFIARVQGLIGKVTRKINHVVDPIIKRAVNFVRPLLGKLGGKDSRPNAPKPKPKSNASAAPAAKPLKPKAAKPPAAGTAPKPPKNKASDHDAKVKVGLAEIPRLEEKYSRDGKLPKSAAKRIAKEIKLKHPIFKRVIAHVDQGKKARYQWFASEGWENGIKELWGRTDVKAALQDAKKTAPNNWAALFATGGIKIEGQIAGTKVHLNLRTIWREAGRDQAGIVDELRVAILRTVQESGLKPDDDKKAKALVAVTAQKIYNAIADKELHFVSNAGFIRALSSASARTSPYILLNPDKKFTTYATNAKNADPTTDFMMTQLQGEIHHALSLYLGGSNELSNLIRAEGKARDPQQQAAHYLFHNMLDHTTIQAANSLSGQEIKLGWSDLLQAFPEDAQKILIGTITESASISYRQVDLDYKARP